MKQTNTRPSELVSQLIRYLYNTYPSLSSAYECDYIKSALTDWLLDNEITLVKLSSGNQNQVPVSVS